MLQNKFQDAGPSQKINATALKGQGGLKRIILAKWYSFEGRLVSSLIDGLLVATLEEAAFRQLLLLNIALISFTYLLDITSVERAMLIMVTAFTLIVELVNTAIEAVIDRISPEIHPLSKQAKDMGSAAQLLSLILVATIWLVICI